MKQLLLLRCCGDSAAVRSCGAAETATDHTVRSASLQIQVNRFPNFDITVSAASRSRPLVVVSDRNPVASLALSRMAYALAALEQVRAV